MAHLHAWRRTAGGTALYYGWFEAMHSRADIMLCGEVGGGLIDEAAGGRIVDAIFEEVHRIEGRLNRFDPASDIGRLNGSPAGRYELDGEVGDGGGVADGAQAGEIAAILSDAARLCTLTLGMFDIAIQTPGYSPGAQYYTPGESSVELLRSGIVFDLGGYAKGYALERIRALLGQFGVKDALVSLGNSSVLGLGSAPGHDGWRIGIENPLTAQTPADGALTGVGGRDAGGGHDHRERDTITSSEPLGVVTLRGNAMSTSGNNLHNEGHILSPLTGCGVTGRRMVSVVAPSGSDAEALSTALMAAPASLRPRIEANFPEAQVYYFEY